MPSPRIRLREKVKKGKMIMGKKLLLLIIAVTILLTGTWSEAARFPDFSAKTLEGQDVTNDIFSEKKLTIINFWATWCPPCVGEMPDLGILGRSMPENTQLIGVLLDAKDKGATEKANEILRKAKADFPQLIPSSEMNAVLSGINAIPTTIFVDANGHIVGNPIVGSRSEEKYRTEIEKALKSMPE